MRCRGRRRPRLPRRRRRNRFVMMTRPRRLDPRPALSSRCSWRLRCRRSPRLGRRHLPAWTNWRKRQSRPRHAQWLSVRSRKPSNRRSPRAHRARPRTTIKPSCGRDSFGPTEQEDEERRGNQTESYREALGCGQIRAESRQTNAQEDQNLSSGDRCDAGSRRACYGSNVRRPRRASDLSILVCRSVIPARRCAWVDLGALTLPRAGGMISAGRDAASGVRGHAFCSFLSCANSGHLPGADS